MTQSNIDTEEYWLDTNLIDIDFTDAYAKDFMPLDF
jgi:hypothetical protein